MSGLCGDKVYTPSPRRSEGRRDQLVVLLSEPRREQNLYANPNTDSEVLVCSSIETAVPAQTFKNGWTIAVCPSRERPLPHVVANH
jgi:hypothetical protein